MKRKEMANGENTDMEVDVNPEDGVIEQRRKSSRLDVETTDKSQKYDRQLRLWGDHGQRCLEKASICLLNATATGSEILKCLVLPGIHKFTIVDGGKVCVEDLGNNFFLTEDSIGQSRAVETCKHLQELNGDVHGHHLEQDPTELLENDPEFFRQFSLVLGCRLSESSMLKFGNFLWQTNIPFVVCDNFGFLGYLRVCVPEQAVIESHPDNALEDLRLDEPFTELKLYLDQQNLESMDKLEHSHTPYLIIIFKYLQLWREQNGNAWPKAYKDKKVIKEMIKNGIRKNEEGIEEDEENFQEAIQNVNNVIIETKIPSRVAGIIADDRCEHPTQSKNPKFWIMVRALKEFVAQNGSLPLRGSLPDMFSDSRRYIQLQNLYKEKANQDVEAFTSIVKEILQDLQLPMSFITSEEMKTFCKNSHFLTVIDGCSLHDEVKCDVSKKNLFDIISPMLDMGADVYLIVRIILRFASEMKRYPGQAGDSSDLEKLKDIAEKLSKECGLEETVSPSLLEEILRCKSQEMHSVASVMGGIAAQEIIKIMTRQFVPVDNTFLYNAITQTTLSLKI